MSNLPFSPNWKMDRKTSFLNSPTTTELNDHTYADYVVRAIIIGDTGTGKTSLMRALLKGTSMCNNDASHVLVDNVYKLLPLAGARRYICLDVADPCMRYESYSPIIRRYYARRAICFVVFDVTRRSTFEKLASWIQDFKNHAHVHAQTHFVVIGNKCDRTQDRIVSLQEGEQFTRAVCGPHAMYADTSALTGNNVHSCFLNAVTHVYDSLLAGAYGHRVMYESVYELGIKCQKTKTEKDAATTTGLLQRNTIKGKKINKWKDCLKCTLL
jgi:Ras-related protein Rab-2A